MKIFELMMPGKHVDFFSLDIEGYEMQVLISNDWERFRPSLLLIETNRNANQIYEYLFDQGYIAAYCNGTNTIFTDAKSSYYSNFSKI